MDIFRQKYNNYENFNNMFRKIKKYVFNKTFEYNINKKNQYINLSKISLIGGNPNIEEIIKKYSDIVNIQIDKISNDEIEVMIVNINSQITCSIFILDKERKVATIHDLLSDVSCLKQKVNTPIMNKIIKIIIKICKKMEMEYIELSDSSYHTCSQSGIKYRLDTGNTITSGKPYYYKYGFVYKDKSSHKKVIRNTEKIEMTLTKDINIKVIKRILEYHLTIKKKDENIIDKSVKIIEEIYEKNKDKNIGLFMRELKYKSCDIFAIIYIDIYEYLELEDFSHISNLMIMKI